MSGRDEVLLEPTPPTARLVIDRPAKRNAMTLPMWRLIHELCAQVADDRRIRALNLSGAGPSFCAGADISALAGDDAELKDAVRRAETALRGLPIPTVATIRGHCWGGGVQLAVACDLRIAARDASFALPPARLGVVYPAESLRAMTALIGPSVTKRLIFSGEPIAADEALRVGLVDAVVAGDDLERFGQEWLSGFGPRSLLSQSAAKAIINEIVDGGDGSSGYRRYQRAWRNSPDAGEGPAAFLAKRRPDYTWHPADLDS
ncbi:MAG: enoyl-CoA hydratase/isomerase family protein [Actinomycetales bacterium]